MKKGIIFILFLLLVLLAGISCTNVYTEYIAWTDWEGDVDGFDKELSEYRDGDIEFTLKSDYPLKGDIIVKITYLEKGTKDKITLKAEGKYYVDNDKNFEAIADGNSCGYDYEIRLEGKLDKNTGYGDGDYKLNFDDEEAWNSNGDFEVEMEK